MLRNWTSATNTTRPTSDDAERGQRAPAGTAGQRAEQVAEQRGADEHRHPVQPANSRQEVSTVTTLRPATASSAAGRIRGRGARPAWLRRPITLPLPGSPWPWSAPSWRRSAPRRRRRSARTPGMDGPAGGTVPSVATAKIRKPWRLLGQAGQLAGHGPAGHEDDRAGAERRRWRRTACRAGSRRSRGGPRRGTRAPTPRSRRAAAASPCRRSWRARTS